MLVSHGFLGWKQVRSFPSVWFIHAVRLYGSSGATEKCFSVNKCPFKDQGYCLAMSKSISEQYFRWNQKQNQKHIFWLDPGPCWTLPPNSSLPFSTFAPRCQLNHFLFASASFQQSLVPSMHFSLLYFCSSFFSCHSIHVLFITKLSVLFSTVLTKPFLGSSL